VSINEIAVEQLRRLGDLYSRPLPRMVIDSIAEANTCGLAWELTSGDAAPLYVLWDQGNNIIHLSCDRPTDGLIAEAAALFTDRVRDEALAGGLNFFRVSPGLPDLESALPSVLKGYDLKSEGRMFYALPVTSPLSESPPVPDGVAVVPITRSLLTDSSAGGIRLVKAEIDWMWPSFERFYQSGFGHVALLDNRVAGWCTSEFVSARACGLGIEIAEELRRKGIGTAIARAFVEACRERAIQPHWESRSGNLASMRVAEKLGFEQVDEMTLWAGRFVA
jgi:GNAT superfamily N-acetyltransferase